MITHIYIASYLHFRVRDRVRDRDRSSHQKKISYFRFFGHGLGHGHGHESCFVLTMCRLWAAPKRITYLPTIIYKKRDGEYG